MWTTLFVMVVLLSCASARPAVAKRVPPGAKKPPPADAEVRSATWSEIPWPVRLRLLYRIAVAPKLLYRVEALTVYRDGVWADYSVTNLGANRKYLTPGFLGYPVGNMTARDSAGRRWRIPQFQGYVQYNPDTFVSVEPGRTIRYRQQVSFFVRKPLELVDPPRGRRPGHPAELRYFIAQWSDAYTKLTADKEERESVYLIGCGRVPVRWVDKHSPKSWQPQTRLYGDGK